MTRAEVTWLLGAPPETSVVTAGQNTTDGAWSAVQWRYESDGRALILLFEKDFLNSWRWYDGAVH